MKEKLKGIALRRRSWRWTEDVLGEECAHFEDWRVRRSEKSSIVSKLKQVGGSERLFCQSIIPHVDACIVPPSHDVRTKMRLKDSHKYHAHVASRISVVQE